MIDPNVFVEVVGGAGGDFPLLHEDFDAVAKEAAKSTHLNIVMWELLLRCLPDRATSNCTAGDLLRALRSTLVMGFLIGRSYENLAAIKSCVATKNEV